MTEITIPYAYTPRDYQLPFLKAKQRFKIAVMHRRAGKSKTALNQQISRALTKKGIYYYFLPTYRQSKSVMWDSLIKEHVPLEVVDKINDSELAIYYKNGSIQRFAGCEDIDKHRGINPIDVVFDEYSEISEKMWTAIIQPILRENKGTATFIFTPKGMNHSWRLVQQAKENPEEWFVSINGVDKTNVFTEEELEEIKRNTPQALYDQEYNCVFLEGAGQFFRRIMENRTEEKDKPEPIHKYQMGIDLAKYQDYTVITAIDLNTFKVHKQERFNQIDWNLQKAKIEASWLRYGKPLIYMDSTGLGDPIYDDLLQRGINVFSYKFTEQSRKDLLVNLQLQLEQNKIRIPDNETLLSELQSFHYEMSDSGRTKIVVPEGLHDDCVFSLALAVFNLPQNPVPLPGSVRFLNRTFDQQTEQTSYE